MSVLVAPTHFRACLLELLKAREAAELVLTSSVELSCRFSKSTVWTAFPKFEYCADGRLTLLHPGEFQDTKSNLDIHRPGTVLHFGQQVCFLPSFAYAPGCLMYRQPPCFSVAEA